MTRQSEVKKLLSAIVVVLMIMTVIFSAFFIARESAHHCSDDNCPICISIQQSMKLLHHVFGGTTDAGAVPFLIPALILSVLIIPFLDGIRTPVSLKIRLNN